MTPSSLFRLSGLALLLAAATFAIAELISFYIFAAYGGAYDLRQIARSGVFFFQSLLTLLAGTLLLRGLVGLYVRQSEEAGKLGLIGFLVAFFGTALVVGDFYTNTFVTPLVALEAPAFLANPLSGILQVWLPVSFGVIAFSLLLVGLPPYEPASTRVSPRGSCWSLRFWRWSRSPWPISPSTRPWRG
jgi:hypothetical protein